MVGEEERGGFAPARKAEEFFPLRCERKPQHWLAAALARKACR
jgi:hypothetical protein